MPILATSAEDSLRRQHLKNLDFAKLLDSLPLKKYSRVQEKNTVKGVHHVLAHFFSLCSNRYVDFIV